MPVHEHCMFATACLLPNIRVIFLSQTGNMGNSRLLPTTSKGHEMRATPEQSSAWLRSRMDVLGITSLEELAERCNSDKGNLSRIFRQQQRPRVDALEFIAHGLEIGVYETLVRIGAVDPVRDIVPTVTKKGQTVTFTWPRIR